MPLIKIERFSFINYRLKKLDKRVLLTIDNQMLEEELVLLNTQLFKPRFKVYLVINIIEKIIEININIIL